MSKWSWATLIITAGVLVVAQCTGHDDEHYKAQVDACVNRGVKYFMELGRYPKLSDGRIPHDVALERCQRTLTAF
jgi:hypothetical protein